MKKILTILVSLIIFLGIWYQYQDVIRARSFPFLNMIFIKLGILSAPCESPIDYTIGTFSKEFNISESYFLSALSDAEAIWEDSFGKELFSYVSMSSSPDVLKINLTYDYRQQATDKLDNLGIVVQNNRSSFETLRSELLALKTKYEVDKSVFNARISAFNQKELAYEKEVVYWNGQGGAPKQEYENLIRDRQALDSESRQLKTFQDNLNETVDEINALVVALNRLISSLNLSVEKYNTTSSARGESFEEGVYISEGSGRMIDVYEFSNREKLVRVLAHEFGHALDLGHVNDPKAIMYEFNEGGTQALTVTDLLALQAKCGIK